MPFGPWPRRASSHAVIAAARRASYRFVSTECACGAVKSRGQLSTHQGILGSVSSFNVGIEGTAYCKLVEPVVHAPSSDSKAVHATSTYENTQGNVTSVSRLAV